MVPLESAVIGDSFLRRVQLFACRKSPWNTIPREHGPRGFVYGARMVASRCQLSAIGNTKCLTADSFRHIGSQVCALFPVLTVDQFIE